MSTSDYKLTIGNVTYTLNQATTSTRLGNVTLTKLTFDKGIYRPGEPCHLHHHIDHSQKF